MECNNEFPDPTKTQPNLPWNEHNVSFGMWNREHLPKSSAHRIYGMLLGETMEKPNIWTNKQKGQPVATEISRTFDENIDEYFSNVRICSEMEHIQCFGQAKEKWWKKRTSIEVYHFPGITDIDRTTNTPQISSMQIFLFIYTEYIQISIYFLKL